jgi:hypothetical protein
MRSSTYWDRQKTDGDPPYVAEWASHPGVQDESTAMGVPAHHRQRTILVGTLVKADAITHNG